MVTIGTNNAGDPAKVVTADIFNDVRTIRELHPEEKILLLPIFPRGEAPDNGYRFWCDAVMPCFEKYAR